MNIKNIKAVKKMKTTKLYGWAFVLGIISITSMGSDKGLSSGVISAINKLGPDGMFSDPKYVFFSLWTLNEGIDKASKLKKNWTNLAQWHLRNCFVV